MFRIAQRPIGNVMILDLHGRIASGDPENALRDAIKDVAGRGYRDVVLNFARASSHKVSAISALLEANAAAHEANGELKLVGLSRGIKDLIVLAALHRYFPVFDSEGDALESCGAVARFGEGLAGSAVRGNVAAAA